MTTYAATMDMATQLSKLPTPLLSNIPAPAQAVWVSDDGHQDWEQHPSGHALPQLGAPQYTTLETLVTTYSAPMHVATQPL
jgi:hypothetical protein